MKKLLSSVILAGTLAFTAQGALYTYNYTGPFADNGSGAGVIPDNNPAGLSDSHTLTGIGTVINSITLNVTLSGSFVSDLTGYLRLGNQPTSTTVSLDSYLNTGANSISLTSSAFNGQNPNDTWTLFFADTSPGGETTLTGWSLEITAVPEPILMALGIFGGCALARGLWKLNRVRRVAHALHPIRK